MSEWRPIKDFPNYMISDYGAVKNIKRDRLVSQHESSGRWCVTLYKNNVQYMLLVSRLLAEAFIPQPEGANCVKYKNGNSLDTTLSNLYWATEKDHWSNANKARRKPVVCVETGERFDSVRACTEATGFSTKKVFKSIREGCAVELRAGTGRNKPVVKAYHFIKG